MDEQEKKDNFANKEEVEKNNKQLKIILIIGGLIIMSIFGLALFIDSVRNFGYNGLKFEIQKEGEVIIYTTAFPVYSSITGKQVADYNIYLRNDPRKIKDIPIIGEINLQEIIVINISEEFDCNKDEVIAVANMVQIFGALGNKVMKDQNATCDDEGRYTFVQIKSGNETNIEQFGPSCYYLNVNNCEILQVTERFIIEKILANQGVKVVLAE